MALQTIQERIYFPAHLGLATRSIQPGSDGSPYRAEGAASQVNSATDMFQQIGMVQWEDGSSGRTVSKILFRVGTITTNLGGTDTLRVGMQGVTTSGSQWTGDGTWKCYGTTSADLTASASNSVTMSVTNSTVSTGDLVSVVIDFSVWASADININTISGGTTHNNPQVNSSGTSVPAVPCVVFQATTGQWGILAGGGWASTAADYRFNSSGTTAPSATSVIEYGNTFQLPFRCRATGFWWVGRGQNATATAALNLYRGAPTTPGAAIKTVSGGVNTLGPATSSSRFNQVHFSPVTIEKDTDYLVTIKSTGADEYRMPVYGQGLGAGSVLPGGGSVYLAYRAGTGAFTTLLTEYMPMGLIIDQIDDSSGQWAPGSGTTGNTLQVEVDPSAVGATTVSGAVFAAPEGSNIVGAKIGEFTGENFEAALVDGKAVLKVPVTAFGGTGLLLADTPVVLVRNQSYTTGFVTATVINE